MKKLFAVQALVLLGGAVFAWYNVIKNFIRFYGFEGTIFKIQDCVIPNPVTEACFYGAGAFLVAFVWSAAIMRRDPAKAKKLQQYLWWFLGGGTIFAWFNVTREFIAFYTSPKGSALGCSALPITNPFLTPCFTGASIFLLAAVLGGIIYYQLTRQVKNN